ncbi:MAG TPA: hypothetical protein ENI15_07460 [Spirochaetes bacterium]|nr:hypothetical protein [Spirochaetota bacterium]
MDRLSDLEKLRFYRDEVKHEFNLLAMRSTILVTCQSFLVVPFAILQTVAGFRAVLVIVFLIAILGVFVALVLREPINAAHRTINKWLIKQRGLMQVSEELADLAIDRDMIPGADAEIDKDKDHIRSLAFSRLSPWAFCIFWIAAVVWSVIRAYVLN